MLHCGARHAAELKTIKKSLLCLFLVLQVPAAFSAELVLPSVGLDGVETGVRIRSAAPGEALRVVVADRVYLVEAAADGTASLPVIVDSPGVYTVTLGALDGRAVSAELRVLPGWLSVLPPLVAILVALAVRNVIPALMLGIWLGATALQSFTLRGVFTGLLDGFQVFVVDALANHDNASIVLFSMMMGGMVGIITRNGGMAAVVRYMVVRARSAVGAQVSVWLLGLMIFFDDYSNTLVVGNTARALTDRLGVSREKLAYLVDSTAAPIVCLALATTWIGYEVGLIDASIRTIDGIDQSAYSIFLASIPYSFYPILAVLFVLAVAVSGRDFGPMYRAELRARNGQVEPQQATHLPSMHGDNLTVKEDVVEQAGNAVIPIVVLITALVASLYLTGSGDTLSEIIGSADAYRAMLWASLLGAVVAAILSVGRRVLTTVEVVDAWFGGVRAMLFAMIVLVLAWALSAVTGELHTADYLVSIMAEGMSPAFLPATVFLLSAATAFTTGTSWGTMGILMPLVIPLAWAVMMQNGLDTPDDMHILYSSIACNLAGAVWGDHCSPISDTTVLSSMASGCDHIEHVRTQMPYAFVVGAAALGLGTLPAGFGLSPLLLLPVAIAVLIAFLVLVGRRSGDAGPA